jgi:antitoxin CcdA
MSQVKPASSVKKRTNLSINESLLNEAKELGINISNSAELGIKHALLERKKALWLKANQEAIDSSNEYVTQNGLPLDKFRHF